MHRTQDASRRKRLVIIFRTYQTNPLCVNRRHVRSCSVDDSLVAIRLVELHILIAYDP